MSLPRILIVDDDADLLASLRRSLRGRFRIFTAEGSREALALLEEIGPVEVAVSDLKMPGADGIELLTDIRKRFPDTVRILLTGYADLGNALSAVNRSHVFRILTKPCTTEEFQSAVAAALEQHELIRSRRELEGLKKVKQAMEGIIRGFSRLVEARDPYTAGHQMRVCEIAVALADRLGLNGDRLAGLKMAAMVHDIGKISVPAEILNKPGRLAEAEFGIIKAHPVTGYEILEPVSFDVPVASIVRQHHERLDGSGYPDGLTDKDILPEAKILAVADVVEAMHSHRPYRPGLGLEAALDEIRSGSGTIYDPDAVQACLELAEEQRLPHAAPGNEKT